MQIAIFAFNRPDLLQRTLTALVANDLANKASVTFFCDGPRLCANWPKQSRALPP